MARKTYSYLGRGMIYLQPLSGGALMPVGNVSQAELSVETNSITQADYTTEGGGNANEVQRVADITLAMTMLELSPQNLVIALRGTAAEQAGQAIAAERHQAYRDGLIALAELPDLSQPVTVTHDPDGTPTALTLDTDFALTRAGIIMQDTMAYTDGDPVDVGYTSMPADIIEAMTTSGDEYMLVLDGLNEAETGKAVVLTIYKVKWSPTSGLGFITDEFGELPLEGSVLSDPTKVGAGISTFFKVALAR